MSQKHERVEEEGGIEVQPVTKKPYAKPKILHELELETRAGSPLDMPNPFDPFGMLDPLGLLEPKD